MIGTILSCTWHRPLSFNYNDWPLSPIVSYLKLGQEWLHDSSYEYKELYLCHNQWIRDCRLHCGKRGAWNIWLLLLQCLSHIFLHIWTHKYLHETNLVSRQSGNLWFSMIFRKFPNFMILPYLEKKFTIFQVS